MTVDVQFSVLQAGFTVHGDIVSDRGMTCLGFVDGSVSSTAGLVHIAKGSVIRGNVEAEHIVLDGMVEGNVVARCSLLLNGRAKGRIVYGGTIRLGANADLEGATLSRTPILTHSDPAGAPQPSPSEPIS